MKITFFFVLVATLSVGLAQTTTHSPSQAEAPSAPSVLATNAPTAKAVTGEAASAASTAPLTQAIPAAQGSTNGMANGQTNGTAPPAYVILPNGQKGVRLNFRGAPLEKVLSYLSKAAGFIINLETSVSGRVDVWSEQPMSMDEAVNLLDSVLHRNGYAALRNGRTLTIVSRDNAKTRDIPVRVLKGGAEEIPKNDQMVTQIIPVRYANAVAMTRDLVPLLPEYATLTANESGNALVLTDIQSDARRMAEIVKALDTSIAGIATIKVFPLRFADAKDLANEIKELFPAPSNTGRGGPGGFNPLAMMFGGGRGGGRGGGGFGGGMPGAAGGTGASEARQAASRVAAVADERTNSLVVSAPEEVIGVIEKLVQEVDTNAENITEVRVFHLANADPNEMANVISNLFPDDTRTDSNRSAIRFGRGGFFGPPGGFGAAAANNSTRARQKGRVLAVPDARTGSLVVTAANDLMPQIAEMIAQLDADPARKQKVAVYKLNNADADAVQLVLQDAFGSTLSRNNRNQNNNALSMRQTQGAQSVGQVIMQQSNSSRRNAFGGSSF